MILDQKTTEFIEVLSSKEPVPGGGGGAALVGALGAAMGLMVSNLTIGKEKYAPVEEEVKQAMEKLSTLQSRLIKLVDQDALGFLPLSKAYGLPTATTKERERKERIMEEALYEAIKAPLAMMEASFETMDLLRMLSEKGSTLAVSDAGVGILFADSAIKAASLNVFINTKLMKQTMVRESLNQKAKEIIDAADRIKNEVYHQVLDKLMA